MTTDQIKLNVEDIIASLQNLNNAERAKLQSALFELQSDLDLQQAIKEGLDDVKNGRVIAHEAVMRDIKAKHNC